ncbi:MAG: PQQ-dependent sugar dehydrogenase [Methylophilus sp.]
MHLSNYVIPCLLTITLGACGDAATLSVADGTGPTPILPSPNKSLVPTVHIATAVGWQGDAKPNVASGLEVNAFAKDLDHPRWLYELPNGDVLVAETNSPPKPEDGKGIRGWFMGKVMAQAGAGVPTANRITLLRDNNKDGVADEHKVFLQGLNSPFGMALIGNDFYVANADSVVRFEYVAGQTEIIGTGTKIADLPGGPINHHWTKNIIASNDGSKLYITVGSNSNVAERGMENEVGRAAIWELDLKSGQHRIFASGLRNPNGLAWEPSSNALWVVVNERDEIGSDLVPDYLTSVKDGGFYGWPYSYYGQHVDERVQPQDANLVASAIAPDFALGPHTASLGLTSSKGNQLSEEYQNGMFVGQHGSWNRKPFSGYKVIFVPFKDSKPSGAPIDVLTGFINDKDEAHGRPVGVLIDNRGGLLVADDVGNTIWRVTKLTTPSKPN